MSGRDPKVSTPAIIPLIALNTLANQYCDIVGRLFRVRARFKF